MVAMRSYLIVVGSVILAVAHSAEAEVIIATETGRGEYEKGVFTPGKPEFRYRFDVDERAGKARLTEAVRLKNDAVIEDTVEYVITAVADGTAISSILVSEARRNQRILTLVGKPGSLAIEVILLGDDFFEYCKASSGRLYLSTGTVKRAISGEKDILQQLMDRTRKKPEQKDDWH